MTEELRNFWTKASRPWMVAYEISTVAKPATALDAVDESDHATDVGKVNEGIAYVAAGLEVDTEVHEVVGAEADLVEGGLERQL
jgi:hypothetical protein